MKKIRIAQIGINWLSHSRDVFYTLKKYPEIFDIAGYCIVEGEDYPAPLEEMKDYPRLTLDEILNDPTIEAVTVETDEIHLTKYAIMAAEHGKHIHMEKPGGASLPDFEHLIAAMKKSGKVFSTGYMYRYNPLVKEALRKVKSGELGDIISVEAQMNCLHTKSNRQWLECMPGGMMFYLGCHLVDLVLQIRGTPTNIIPLNKSTGSEGVTALDFGMAVMEYPNGVSIVKTSAAEIGGFRRRQLVISGTKSTVEIRPLEIAGTVRNSNTAKMRYVNDGNWHTDRDFVESESFDRYDDMILAFADFVYGKRTNPYTLDYELELFKTVLKCCGE